MSRQLGALHLLQELLVFLPAGDRVGRGHEVAEGGLAAGLAGHSEAGEEEHHRQASQVSHPHWRSGEEGEEGERHFMLTVSNDAGCGLAATDYRHLSEGGGGPQPPPTTTHRYREGNR